MTDLLAREGRIPYKWLAMAAVGAGTFMATLDASIVNVSWPTIMIALDADRTTTQWVVAVYLLVITGLLLSLGRLADLKGRKPIYIIGFGVFTAGSLFCGLSPTIQLLIAARVVQGVGAAMIMAVGPAILTDAFPGTERGKAMGMMGMTVAVGLMTGPALGGFLIHIGGWPLVFLINIPIGIAGIALSWAFLHREERRPEHHFDFPGAALLLVALISLTLALSEGPEAGWRASRVVALLVAFLIFGVAFLLRERTAVHPIIDLALFRNRTFAAASAGAFAAYLAIFSVTFQMPFYLSGLLGYDTRSMGLILTSVPLSALVISPLSGILSDRFGSRALGVLGLVVTTAGLLTVSRLGLDASTGRILGSLIVIGIGSAIFQAPNNSAIMGSAPPSMLGVAAGMLATMRNLGMISAVAVSGAVYETSLRLRLQAGMPDATASVQALQAAFLVSAGVAALGAFSSSLKQRN